jgi:O-antigen/teichoic acid export membrane protein
MTEGAQTVSRDAAGPVTGSPPASSSWWLGRLGRDSLVYGLAAGTNKFLGFLLLPLYTRIFSPADYGVLDVIATITALAGMVLTAGTETALSYYFFKQPEATERRATVTATAAYLAGINLLVAAMVWVAAPALTGLVFGSVEYAPYLQVAIIALPFGSLVALNLNVLRLEGRPWAYLGLSVPHFFLTLVLNIVLVAVLGYGLMGVFVSNVVSSLAFAGVGVVFNRRHYGGGVRLVRLGQVIRYGLPLVVGGVSMWTINFADRFFLLRYASLDEIGHYSVGLRIASIVAFATLAFRTANAPLQFQLMTNTNAREVYASTLSVFVLAASTLTVLVGAFARPLLNIVTTEAFLEAYRVVALGAWAAVLYGLYQLVSIGLLVRERTGVTGTVIGMGALVNLALLYFLVPPLGMVGAALSVALTHLTVVVVLYRAAQHEFWVPYDLAKVSKVVGCAIAVLALDWARPMTGLWLDLLAGTGAILVFAVAIHATGALDARERRWLRRAALAPFRRLGWAEP